MKQVLLLLTLLLSFNSFGQEFDGLTQDPSQFQDMMSSEMTETNWSYSSTSCYAYTTCPNGRRIYCQVYGYNYSSVPSRFSNSCSFAVWPGRAVQCKGYAQQSDYYGNYYWSYVNIPVSCY